MKRLLLLTFTAAVIVLSLGALGYTTFAKQYFAHSPWEAPASMQEVVDEVLADRAQNIEESGEVNFGQDNEINVLVLGLDSRKANHEPHCDAIHMFTLNIEDWSIQVTSVPRGTYAYIPPGTYPENEYYLANACAFAGLDYGIEQIENIAGVKADYVATVGFSQVIGIMRTLELPTTESLQWLRHRQSYAIGDPQRSHNQAVFMKDLILTQADKLRGDLGTPLVYVLYSIINTDMDYKVARALVNGYLESDIDERPEDITLSMRPYYATQDLHLDLEHPEEQIDQFLEFIKPYLSEEDLSGRELEDIQSDLIVYLEGRLAAEESVSDVYEKRLWLQIEEDMVREQMHYAFLERYAREVARTDSDRALDIITQYIFEKQTLGETDYANLGRDLMSELIKVEI